MRMFERVFRFSPIQNLQTKKWKKPLVPSTYFRKNLREIIKTEENIRLYKLFKNTKIKSPKKHKIPFHERYECIDFNPEKILKK